MYIDPSLISWILISGASFCAFMVGMCVQAWRKDSVINDTIMYLIENNFINAEKDHNGEWEIIPLDDKK